MDLFKKKTSKPTRRPVSMSVLSRSEIMKISKVTELRSQLLKSVEFGKLLLEQNSALQIKVDKLSKLSEYHRSQSENLGVKVAAKDTEIANLLAMLGQKAEKVSRISADDEEEKELVKKVDDFEISDSEESDSETE